MSPSGFNTMLDIIWTLQTDIMTTQSQYPASTLALTKGKFYVCCTIPLELRLLFKNQRQLKRSTGTSDQNVAKRKQHQITTAIYSEFDEAAEQLGTPSNLVRQAIAQHAVGEFKIDGWNLELSLVENLQRLADQSGTTVGFYTSQVWQQLTPEIQKHLFENTDDPDIKIKYLTQFYLNSSAWDQVLRDGGVTPAPVKQTSVVTISRLQQEYLEKNRWNRVATKNQFMRGINELREFLGDIPVSEITPHHGYDWAQKLSDEGVANRTISGRITASRSMFEFGIRHRHLQQNPFSGLRLSSYGAAPQSYLPLEKDELHKLFSQPMKDHERLALTLLLTTGMRLDEVALLRGDQIKTNEAGFRYVDLRQATTKNIGSSRQVPLHADVHLLETQGRLFNYATNADGKAWNSAGNALGPLVRAVTDNPRKVLHSLRGTLKDLLRDAGVSKEVNDFITGHGQGDIASKYGSGPSLEVRYEAIASIKHPWLAHS